MQGLVVPEVFFPSRSCGFQRLLSEHVTLLSGIVHAEFRRRVHKNTPSRTLPGPGCALHVELGWSPDMNGALQEGALFTVIGADRDLVEPPCVRIRCAGLIMFFV
jgi:hypothetical protein